MDTLGITESKQYRKLDIAKDQLVEAIRLFTSEKFLFAITLAGSAEEIFAGLVKAEGKKPIIESSYEQIENLRKNTSISIMGDRDKRSIIKEWNHVKNRTKHHDSGEENTIVFNACDEAYWLIKRAIENSKLLNLHIPNEKEFESWVIVNACL